MAYQATDPVCRHRAFLYAKHTDLSCLLVEVEATETR